MEHGNIESSRRYNKSLRERSHNGRQSHFPPPKPSLVSSEDDSEHEDLEDLSQRSRHRAQLKVIYFF